MKYLFYAINILIRLGHSGSYCFLEGEGEVVAVEQQHMAVGCLEHIFK